jgi:flagellar biogenesis protein FliO
MMRPLSTVLLLVLLLTGPVSAQPEIAIPGKPADNYSPPTWPKTGPSSGLLGGLGLLTLLAVGLAGVVFWWSRRTPQVTTASTGEPVSLEVVASASLGGRCTLHLLQVEEVCFVVGVDSSGLKAIQHLPEPFDELLHLPATTPPSSSSAPEAA